VNVSCSPKMSSAAVGKIIVGLAEVSTSFILKV